MEKQFSKEEGYSYLNSQYKIIEKLGVGGTAKVKLAQNLENGELVALKIFKDPKDSKLQIKFTPERVLKEFKSIENLKHVNMVNVLQVFEDAIYEKKNGKSYKTTTIVLEYVQGGECFEYISYFKGFSEIITRSYFHQLMEGLMYIHNEGGITHRDLKQENLLFDKDYILKIADFGFSRTLAGDNNDGKLYTKLGTQGYQAPELLDESDKDESEQNKFNGYDGKKIDIFACGVLLFEFISGSPPFEISGLKNNKYNNFMTKKEKFWQYRNKKGNKYSPQLITLIDGMLELDPEKRFNMDQILKSDWYNDKIMTQDELKNEMQKKHETIKQLQLARKSHNKKEGNSPNKRKKNNQKVKQAQNQFRSSNEDGESQDLDLIEVMLKGIYKPQELNCMFKKEKSPKLKREGDLVFEDITCENLFKILLINIQNMCQETPQISKNNDYKIKCYKVFGGVEEIFVNIKLYKYNEYDTQIVFERQMGSAQNFYKFQNEVQDKLIDIL